MTWKPHVTVAAIIEREQRFLIVEEIIDGEHRFNQPAGHLEAGESLVEAAIRETREETGWRFLPEAVTGIYQWRQPDNGIHFLRFSFCGQCDDFDENLTLDEGIVAARWLRLDELRQHAAQCRSPMVIGNIEDYLAGRRYPLSMLTMME